MVIIYHKSLELIQKIAVCHQKFVNLAETNETDVWNIFRTFPEYIHDVSLDVGIEEILASEKDHLGLPTKYILCLFNAPIGSDDGTLKTEINQIQVRLEELASQFHTSLINIGTGLIFQIGHGVYMKRKQ